MKAIKIPNTSLLDVFGRPVATNTYDFHRLSYADKNVENNHYEQNSKSSNATNSGIKSDNAERLTIIGLLRFRKKKEFFFVI